MFLFVVFGSVCMPFMSVCVVRLSVFCVYMIVMSVWSLYLYGVYACMLVCLYGGYVCAAFMSV